jgi:hypothetical protein
VVKDRNSIKGHLPHLHPSPFFESVRLYQKINQIQMAFIEDLVLMIVKGSMPLSIVESPWLR